MAMLSLTLCVSPSRPAIPFDLPSDDDLLPMYMAWIALRALIVDTVEMVKLETSGVLKPRMLSLDAAVRKSTKKKMDALKEWCKKDSPLSYTDPKGNRNGNLELLALFLADARERLDGLPLSVEKSISYRALGLLLYGMGKNNNTQVRAPVTKDGHCLYMLRVIIAYITSHYPIVNKEEYFTTLFAACAQRMTIQFIPWMLPTPPGPGRRRTSPHANIWVEVGQGPGETRSIAPHIRTDEEVVKAMVEKRQRQNPTGDWSIEGKLDGMAELLLKKTCLPDNWSIKAAGTDDMDGYVGNTYEYVYNNYDGSNWQHHLALICATFFSYLRPNLFWDATIAKDVKKLRGANIDEKIQAMAWKAKDRKGLRNQAQLVTMMSTYIIAMLDSNSPLRKHLAANDNAFGTVWTTKHCKNAI
jgi:hypothetical protein